MNWHWWGRIAARWTTELVVVFVGVYGAFAVAEWDEGREREERAAQVKAVLAEEVRDIQSRTFRAARQVPGFLHQMDSLMAAGTPFPLAPQMEAIGFQTHVWDASMASGALALLDVETFFLASLYYNQLRAGLEQLEQLRELSQALLVPSADAPASSRFEPDPESPGSIRLKPQYGWYLSGFYRVANIARCSTVLGDSLLVHLGQTPDSAHASLDTTDC